MKSLLILVLSSVLISCNFSEQENGSNGEGVFELDGIQYSLNNARIVRSFDGANFYYNICFSNNGACVDYGLFQKGTREHLKFALDQGWSDFSIPLGEIEERGNSNVSSPSLIGISGALDTIPYGKNSAEGFSKFSFVNDFFVPEYTSADYSASLSINRNQDLYDVEFSVGPFQNGVTLTGYYTGTIDLSPPPPSGLALD